MPLRFEATAPDALPEIITFLQGVFGDSPNLRPAVLRWKYYESGPDWPAPRSYVLRDDAGSIVAHTAAWPIHLLTSEGPVQALQALDWAGTKSSPGAGISIMSRLRTLSSVLITVGGSPATRRILPAMGFKQLGEIGNYARVLRPWGQFRTRRWEGPRSLARLLRNTGWSRPPVVPHQQWTAEPSHPGEAVHWEPAEFPASHYSPQFLSFLERCPASKMKHFTLKHTGTKQGYCMLSRVGGQTRIADLRLLSQKPEDWTGAYAAAIDAALQDPQACELVAHAPTPLTLQAIQANGFRWRGSSPVFVLDPKNLLKSQPHLSMLDDDSAYLTFPNHPYLT